MPIQQRIQYITIWILRALTLVALALALTRGNLTEIINAIVACFLIFLPEFIERRYRIKLLPEFSFLIVLFMYLSIVLGGVDHYYYRFWWWDVLLHVGSGLMLGTAGFLIIFVLYETKQFRANALLISFLVVCFSLALGAFWEIFEFSMDEFFKLTLQPSLFDTMKDLINDAVGAIIVAIFGYGYIHFERGWIFAGLMRNFFEKNPHLKERSKFAIKE